MVFPLQAVCVIINNMIKKADIILFILILVLGLGVSWWSLAGNSAGDKVVVSVNGETYGIYDLDKNQEITVSQNGHTNHIIIKDGICQMDSSSCKNQVCVDTGAISRVNSTIVCLPNKVVVTIKGKEKGGDVDVISE